MAAYRFWLGGTARTSGCCRVSNDLGRSTPPMICGSTPGDGYHSAAAEVQRAQPGRERLSVHARQLALQPHLQILRRSRRPLLCGMEQARRSALAHHVHRTAPMDPRVLINGIWYKCSGSVWPRVASQHATESGLANASRTAGTG